MTRTLIDEFFEGLEGPEGCDFSKSKDGKITWKCAGGTDKSLSRAILTKMNITKKQAEAFLRECDSLGGHCDCEILFNAEPKMRENT